MSAVADTMLLAAIEHQRAGRLAEAEALYRSVLAAESGHGQALYLYGLLLLKSGRSHDAAAILGLAAVARPAHTGTSVYFARALLADDRAAEALPVTVRLLVARPDHPEAAFLRGTALNALGKPALAIASFKRALLHDPGHAAACLNLGNANVDIDRWDDAERYCREAIRLAPDLAEAHASLGFILTSRGRLDEAICRLRGGDRTAARLMPRRIGTRRSRRCWPATSLSASANTNGASGTTGSAATSSICPDRNGMAVIRQGRTILVHAEQGFGDTIQFARYLPLMVARGARVVLACERPLIPLLAQLPGVSVVPKDTPLPALSIAGSTR